ncbi:hypothetical protein LINPERHAP2_LOCUS45238, partial [Linum perenne]
QSRRRSETKKTAVCCRVLLWVTFTVVTSPASYFRRQNPISLDPNCEPKRKAEHVDVHRGA